MSCRETIVGVHGHRYWAGRQRFMVAYKVHECHPCRGRHGKMHTSDSPCRTRLGARDAAAREKVPRLAPFPPPEGLLSLGVSGDAAFTNQPCCLAGMIPV